MDTRYFSARKGRLKQQRFCEALVNLWRQQLASGVKKPRVNRLAARMVGYGNGSWTEIRAQQSAETMSRILLRKPEVLDYIRELGLERHGDGWRLVSAGQAGQA